MGSISHLASAIVSTCCFCPIAAHRIHSESILDFKTGRGVIFEIDALGRVCSNSLRAARQTIVQNMQSFETGMLQVLRTARRAKHLKLQKATRSIAESMKPKAGPISRVVGAGLGMGALHAVHSGIKHHRASVSDDKGINVSDGAGQNASLFKIDVPLMGILFGDGSADERDTIHCNDSNSKASDDIWGWREILLAADFMGGLISTGAEMMADIRQQVESIRSRAELAFSGELTEPPPLNSTPPRPPREPVQDMDFPSSDEIGELGRGVEGIVYATECAVVKVLQGAQKARKVAKLVFECTAAHSLKQQGGNNFVDCQGVFRDPKTKRFFMMQDLAPGERLDEAVDTLGAKDFTNILNELGHMARSMMPKEGHDTVVHDDLHPGNLLFDKGAEGVKVKAIDYGRVIRSQSDPQKVKRAKQRLFTWLTLELHFLMYETDFHHPSQVQHCVTTGLKERGVVPEHERAALKRLLEDSLEKAKLSSATDADMDILLSKFQSITA